MPKVNLKSEVKSCLRDDVKSAEENFINLHRKVSHIDQSHTVSMLQIQSQVYNLRSEVKSYPGSFF